MTARSDSDGAPTAAAPTGSTHADSPSPRHPVAPSPSHPVAPSPTRPSPLATRHYLAALALLAFVGAVAHFFYFREFGLYEDDYFFISYAMGDDGSYLAERVANFAMWPQGRPIGFLLPPLLSFVGDRLGGLSGIYVGAFLVVTLNAFLFYVLLRTRFPYFVALAGALFFLLFPGDTTKALLTHSFQLQPSLTFLLLAAILYVRGKTLLSYLVVPGALLAYESAFLPFFAVPLMRARWDRRLAGELARHGAVLVGIFALAVAIRFLVGEERVAATGGGLIEVLPRIAGSMAIGPIRSLLMFLYGPIRELPGWNLPTLLAAASVAAASFALLVRQRPDQQPQHATSPVPAEAEIRDPQSEIRNPQSEIRNPQFAAPLRLLAAGLVMLVLAYSLAFTHFPPLAVFGRGTSVHLAATFGSAVVFAAFAWGVMLVAGRLRLRVLAIGCLTAYLGLVVGYHFTVQREFVRSWDLQQSFWSQVVELAPDMEQGTLLFFALEGSQQTRMIGTNSWADAIVLEQVYRFPEHWSEPPRLYPVESTWTERVEVRNGELWWLVPAASWDEYWAPLPQGNVIFLEADNGTLRRLDGPLSVHGHTLELRQPARAVDPPWEKGVLFDYLVRN